MPKAHCSVFAALASAALCLSACSTSPRAASPGALAAEPEPFQLVELAKLGPGANLEVSGIVRSHRDPTIFWTLGDSENPNRIYAIHAEGKTAESVRYGKEPGTIIGNAIDCDWEDIALDASGRIIICDIGNNSNARADLCFYFVPEPEPTEGRTSALSQVFIRYADQPSLPAPKNNFNYDAEAVYTIDDDIFILTKHRSDTLTTLYCLPNTPTDRATGVVHALSPIATFDTLGKVTGADASPDGLHLAVLTYGRIWVFDRTSKSQSFFEGTVRSRRFLMPDGKSSDSESICFENETSLLIADEGRAALYRVPLSEIPVR